MKGDAHMRSHERLFLHGERTRLLNESFWDGELAYIM